MSKILDKYRVSISVWLDWQRAHPALAAMYRIAQECRAELLSDEIIALSDVIREGVCTRVKTGPDGTTTEVITGDMIRRAQLQVDARKWVACKLYPKKFGDRVGIAGVDDAPAIRIIRERIG